MIIDVVMLKTEGKIYINKIAYVSLIFCSFVPH
jgi:hypothetical protein